MPPSVRPSCFIVPILGSRDNQSEVSVGEQEEDVDRSLAITDDPIIGMDKVVYDGTDRSRGCGG